MFIGVPCFPADRQPVFLHISVHEIVHDTVFNHLLVREGKLTKRVSTILVIRLDWHLFFAARTPTCWGKQRCSGRHPEWRQPEQFHFIQPMYTNIVLANNYWPV